MTKKIYEELLENCECARICGDYAEIVPDSLPDCALFLKDNGYDYLDMITASDHIDEFILTYTFKNLKDKDDVMLRASVSRENPEIPSLSNIWIGADFQERELYDLMGIIFTGHNNLKRIVLWDGFEGHPQRKDYKNVA
ncbi:MAG: NADH-quinone oxidoreductase subunit C [Dehalococcoidales bacterium]|jgi:NADH:ubiquinone oxidoreductase subunit C|nr:NADH-quinone oxidoreductase subunit C [Dehalococcoidales bacterium]